MEHVSKLAESWRRLWNGDLALLDAIVAQDITVHASLLGGSGDDTLRGRAALGRSIGDTHAVIDGLAFTYEVGPIEGRDHVVVRWRARGTYRGGLPGIADAAGGREVDFTGTDILRVAGGLLAEYWVNSDTLRLAQQLGAQASSRAPS